MQRNIRRIRLPRGWIRSGLNRGEMMPLFYVDDPTAVPLAWYDKNPDLTAAAVKRHKNWTAVYSGPGTFSPEFPRALAAEAGIRPVGPLNDEIGRAHV